MSYHKIKKQRTKVNYRKIYENCYGPIPFDEDGRRFDIHHIDGNDENNDPSNLVAVSIKDHYAIHYSQKDWGACYFMAIRMNSDSNIVAELARQYQLSLGDKHPSKRKEHIDKWKSEANPSKSMKHREERRRYQLSLGDKHPLKSESYRKQQSSKMSGKNNITFDHTLYVWENMNSGERVKMTRYDFYTAYNIPEWSVRRYIKGKSKHTRGWKIVRDESCLV
jgi:hypothetical protein